MGPEWLGLEGVDCIHLAQCMTVVKSGIPRYFVRRGVQQIQLKTESRENGDLGAVAP
jgi:hypothetical protein